MEKLVVLPVEAFDINDIKEIKVRGTHFTSTGPCHWYLLITTKKTEYSLYFDEGEVACKKAYKDLCNKVGIAIDLTEGD